MEIRIENDGTRTIAHVSGRIDQTTAPDFQEKLLAIVTGSKGDPIIVDMSLVEFVSSVGLRALMIARKQSLADTGTLVIAALTPTVREVFEISRFDTVFNCFDTLDAALAEIQD